MLNKRVILIRHGEEIDSRKVQKIESSIGLNHQGAIRAELLPNLVKALFGPEGSVAIHVYRHMKNGEPTSRSYYTAQKYVVSFEYELSTEIDKVVENICKSDRPNHLVIWEHHLIPHIIERLVGIEVDYTSAVEKIQRMAKKIEPTKIKVNVKDLTVKYCASYREEENRKFRGYLTSKKRSWEFAVTWEIKCGEVSVYPNFVTRSSGKKGRFKIRSYLHGFQHEEV